MNAEFPFIHLFCAKNSRNEQCQNYGSDYCAHTNAPSFAEIALHNARFFTVRAAVARVTHHLVSCAGAYKLDGKPLLVPQGPRGVLHSMTDGVDLFALLVESDLLNLHTEHGGSPFVDCIGLMVGLTDDDLYKNMYGSFFDDDELNIAGNKATRYLLECMPRTRFLKRAITLARNTARADPGAAPDAGGAYHMSEETYGMLLQLREELDRAPLVSTMLSLYAREVAEALK